MREDELVQCECGNLPLPEAIGELREVLESLHSLTDWKLLEAWSVPGAALPYTNEHKKGQ